MQAAAAMVHGSQDGEASDAPVGKVALGAASGIGLPEPPMIALPLLQGLRQAYPW